MREHWIRACDGPTSGTDDVLFDEQRVPSSRPRHLSMALMAEAELAAAAATVCECDGAMQAFRDIWELRQSPSLEPLVAKRPSDPYRYVTSDLNQLIAEIRASGDAESQ
jgi:hypothetical protein